MATIASAVSELTAAAAALDTSLKASDSVPPAASHAVRSNPFVVQDVARQRRGIEPRAAGSAGEVDTSEMIRAQAGWSEAKDRPWRRPPGVPTSSSDGSECDDGGRESDDSEHLVSASDSEGVASGSDVHQDHTENAERGNTTGAKREERSAARHLSCGVGAGAGPANAERGHDSVFESNGGDSHSHRRDIINDGADSLTAFATKLRQELDSTREKVARSEHETSEFRAALDEALSQAREQVCELGRSPAPVQLRTPGPYRGSAARTPASGGSALVNATSPTFDADADAVPPQTRGEGEGEAVPTPALTWTEAETLRSQAQHLLEAGEITQEDFDQVQAGLTMQTELVEASGGSGPDNDALHAARPASPLASPPRSADKLKALGADNSVCFTSTIHEVEYGADDALGMRFEEKQVHCSADGDEGGSTLDARGDRGSCRRAVVVVGFDFEDIDSACESDSAGDRDATNQQYLAPLSPTDSVFSAVSEGSGRAAAPAHRSTRLFVNTGQVEPGAELIAINGAEVAEQSFDTVMSRLHCAPRPLKLRFRCSGMSNPSAVQLEAESKAGMWEQCARRAEADKSRALARERRHLRAATSAAQCMVEASVRVHTATVTEIRKQHARVFEVMSMELQQHMETHATELKALSVRVRQHEEKQAEHERSVDEVLNEERTKHAKVLASLTDGHKSNLEQREAAYEHNVEERLSEERVKHAKAMDDMMHRHKCELDQQEADHARVIDGHKSKLEQQEAAYEHNVEERLSEERMKHAKAMDDMMHRHKCELEQQEEDYARGMQAEKAQCAHHASARAVLDVRHAELERTAELQQEMEEKLRLRHKEALSAKESEHTRAINELEQMHKSNMEDQRAGHKETLEAEREAHRRAMTDLALKHKSELEEQQEKHRKELEQQRSGHDDRHTEVLDAERETHAHAIKSLVAQHKSELAKQQARHEGQHAETLDAERAKHSQAMDDLAERHRNELKEEQTMLDAQCARLRKATADSMEKHGSELKQQCVVHEDALGAERAKHAQAVASLVEKHKSELEQHQVGHEERHVEALEAERAKHTKAMADLVEKHRHELEQSQATLGAECASLRKATADSAEKHRDELEQQRVAQEDRHSRVLGVERATHTKAMDDLVQKHRGELHVQQERHRNELKQQRAQDKEQRLDVVGAERQKVTATSTQNTVQKHAGEPEAQRKAGVTLDQRRKNTRAAHKRDSRKRSVSEHQLPSAQELMRNAPPVGGNMLAGPVGAVVGADRWRRPRSTPRGPRPAHAEQGQGSTPVGGQFGGTGARRSFAHQRAHSTPSVGQVSSLRAARGAARRVSRVVEEQDVNTHDIWNPAGSGDSDSDADAGNNGGSGVIIFDD